MLISPAKTLDFDTDSPTAKYSIPEFKKKAEVLVNVLRNYSDNDLKSLMGISSTLATLNYQRFMEWGNKTSERNEKQALTTFIGEVYRGISAADFNESDFDFAQEHLRILSGLYGVLRPLDLIQPYRLEMGTKLKTGDFSNLYQFWGDTINEKINSLAGEGEVVLNLASNEYFKAAKVKQLKARVITPVFKDFNKGELKVVAVYAKKSRGSMVRYIVKNRISNPEQLKLFDVNGYEYIDNLSDENTWVFARDQAGFRKKK